MKKDKLTPRTIARRLCRRHNDFRHILLHIFRREQRADEIPGYWENWYEPALRKYAGLYNSSLRIAPPERLMTHAEARKLVAEQS